MRNKVPQSQAGRRKNVQFTNLQFNKINATLQVEVSNKHFSIYNFNMYNLQFNKINATLLVEASNKHLSIYNFNMYNLQFN